MSSPSRSAKLRQKINLKKYLVELSVLTARGVTADELGSLEHVASLREVSQRFRTLQPSTQYQIPFSEKCSDRFQEFIQKLQVANSAPVYLWTPRTIACGALLVSSIDTVNFDFDFAVNDEGMLVFATNDSEDMLLLDFWAAPTGEQILQIETQGTNWASVAY